MKVLHILRSDRFSGAENVVCQIFDMMRQYPQYEMVYCSQDGPIRQALESRGIAFVPMKKLCASEVKRVLAEEKPDVVHAHDMYASFVVSLVCGRTPLISHVHNNAIDSRGISVKSIAYLLAARKARHIFWVARSAYEGYRFSKWFQKKSSILYNIISVDALYKRMKLDCSEYEYDAVFIGRLAFPKHPQRLAQVFSLVAQKKPDIKVAVVGDGELKAELQSLCNELGLQNNVFLLGFHSNPLKILHDSRVMVMTSRWEGLPMCALESLALGVPIVSTPTDGMKELLEEGKSGFLSDDNEVLAQRIVDIVCDESLHREMSEYAKNKSIQINDIENYRQELIRAYAK